MEILSVLGGHNSRKSDRLPNRRLFFRDRQPNRPWFFRDRILLDLKLGKQAPGYKAVPQALNRFIAELTYPNTSIF